MKKVIIDYVAYSILLDYEEKYMKELLESYPDQPICIFVLNALRNAVVFDPEVTDWNDIKDLI